MPSMPRKLTIEEFKLLAQKRGGQCLSDKYINIDTKLRWKCKEGHIWEAIPYTIKKGSWCPVCAGYQKATIEDMRKIAESREGKCLSEEYINTETKLKWQCKNGHIWEARPHNVKSGQWCPYCAGHMKLSIEDMREIAQRRKGKCLSDKYINGNTKLEWECDKGHIWKASYSSIKLGSWCPKCAGVKRLNIDELRKIAESKGGKCLSDKYVNTRTKLKWECSKGHIWEAAPSNIKNQNQWCPVCAGISKLTIEEMREVAKTRGGKCLSDKYVNGKTKLQWECSEGHVWKATPVTVKHGSWCPECNKYFTEEKCRYVLENLFKEKFSKNRDVLNGYELDGFNKELNLGFEFNGEQHYKFIKFYHGKKEFFEERKRIDELKEKMCIAKGIKLLIIPYFECKTDNNLVEYIIRKLKDFGFNVKQSLESISFEGFYESISTLKELKRIAESKGGKCLSDEYISANVKLKWQCAEGHIWEAKPSTIKNRGTWCPTCAGITKLTIKEMKALAESKGGRCLSNQYKNLKAKLKWQCAQGHIWEAIPGHVKNGHWCPVCANNIKATIEDMNLLATNNRGKCLSTIYKDRKTKLKWQCSEGHTWEAMPSSIVNGSWCPICAFKKVANSKKLTIEEMQNISKSRKGKCLSNEYINANTKLKWQCSKGHIWEAAPGSIKYRGSWCPVCARRK